METKNLCYFVEWWGETTQGGWFTNQKRFECESDALSFITNDLANDSLVRGAAFTTHKTIEFKRGE